MATRVSYPELFTTMCIMRGKPRSVNKGYGSEVRPSREQKKTVQKIRVFGS